MSFADDENWRQIVPNVLLQDRKGSTQTDELLQVYTPMVLIRQKQSCKNQWVHGKLCSGNGSTPGEDTGECLLRLVLPRRRAAFGWRAIGKKREKIIFFNLIWSDYIYICRITVHIEMVEVNIICYVTRWHDWFEGQQKYKHNKILLLPYLFEYLRRVWYIIKLSDGLKWF